MAEILMINPSRRRRKTKTKKKRTTKKTTRRRKTTKKSTTRRNPIRLKMGAKIMAKRRRRKSPKTTTRKRRYRRNPTTSRTRRVARRATSGLSFRRALKNVISLDIGMFAAKFAAKRFGDQIASETDPTTWNAMSYVKAGVGAVGAGLLANMVRPGWGQKIMEGGLAWTVFKAVENEVIHGNATAEKWLGQDYLYEGVGADPNVLVLDEDSTPYMTGQDGQLLPLDESHRMLPSMTYSGDVLTPPGRLGDVLTPPGRLGYGDDRMSMLTAYKRDYS